MVLDSNWALTYGFGPWIIAGEGCSNSEYITAYEDKDGDWMLVGDVPFE